MTDKVTAIVLAGRRPGIDPLAAHFGVDDKALIEIAGETMLSRVARTLLSHPAIGKVIILAEHHGALSDRAELGWMRSEERILFEGEAGTIVQTVTRTLQRRADLFPFLMTTADNPLLSHKMIDYFLEDAAGCDLAVGLVERRVLRASHPGSRRTWLRFRNGAYSGANLFWFAGPRALPVLATWTRIEQKRKRGWAVIAAFGPMILIPVALRLLTVEKAIGRAGKRFGVAAKPVVLPFAEACIDVDKPGDYDLVAEILGAAR